jgi:hypothetical protein
LPARTGVSARTRSPALMSRQPVSGT